MGVVDRHGNPLTDLMWYAHLPDGKPLAPNAVHRFDINLADIPPLPNEAWMPPVEKLPLQGHVLLTLSPDNSGADFWTNELQALAQ